MRLHAVIQNPNTTLKIVRFGDVSQVLADDLADINAAGAFVRKQGGFLGLVKEHAFLGRYREAWLPGEAQVPTDTPDASAAFVPPSDKKITFTKGYIRVWGITAEGEEVFRQSPTICFAVTSRYVVGLLIYYQTWKQELPQFLVDEVEFHYDDPEDYVAWDGRPSPMILLRRRYQKAKEELAHQ